MSSTDVRQVAEARDRKAPVAQPYRQPRLERLGDLRSLTLGSSPGIPDSGIGMPEQTQP